MEISITPFVSHPAPAAPVFPSPPSANVDVFFLVFSFLLSRVPGLPYLRSNLGGVYNLGKNIERSLAGGDREGYDHSFPPFPFHATPGPRATPTPTRETLPPHSFSILLPALPPPPPRTCAATGPRVRFPSFRWRFRPRPPTRTFAGACVFPPSTGASGPRPPARIFTTVCVFPSSAGTSAPTLESALRGLSVPCAFK